MGVLTFTTWLRLWSTKICWGIFVILLPTLYSFVVSAQQTPFQFSEDKERIYLFKMQNGLLISEGMILYEDSQKWMVPLEEFSEGVGIGIKVSPKLGRAEGFIIQKSRDFLLDLKACEVTIDKKLIPFSCDQVSAHQEDIYVELSLLQKWLPLRIKIDPFRSEAEVISLEKLPIESKAERDKRAEKITKQTRSQYDPGYPLLENRRTLFDGFIWDQQFEVKQIDKNKNSNTATSTDTRISGELLGLEANLTYVDSSNSKGKEYFVLSRRDPNGNVLMAGMNTKEIQLIDINFPTLPLVTGPVQGKGAIISSQDLFRSNNFGTHDFRGFLKQNWEVELYQAGVLIGRKESDGTGRYEFNNIPLEFGYNRFRLTFYGPNGEQIDEYQDFNINPKNNKKGQFDYRLGALQSEEKNMQYFSNFTYGAMDNLSLEFTQSVLTDKDDKKNHSYSYFAAHGFFQNLGYTLSEAFDDDGGTILEPQLFYRTSFANLSLVHRDFNNYKSLLYDAKTTDLSNESEGNLSFTTPLHPIRMTFKYLISRYENDSKQSSLDSRIATQLLGMYLNYSLSYQLENPQSYNGSLEGSLNFGRSRVKASYAYNNERTTSYSLSFRNRSSQNYSLQSEWVRSLVEKKDTITAGTTYFFDYFSTNFNASYESTGDYEIGVLFNFSLARDGANDYHLHNQSHSSNGSAIINVFRDLNGNNLKDPDEAPISDMTVRVNQQSVQKKSNKDGQIYVTNLANHQPSDISISLQDLDDPLLHADPEGYRLFARSGKVQTINFAIVAFSEVDGFVTSLSNDEPIKRVIVVLVNESGKQIAQSLTDSEGFYIFEKVPAGKYKILIDPKYSQTKGYTPSPQHIDIDLPASGEFVNDQNFTLE